jgi:hypothetical protein
MADLGNGFLKNVSRRYSTRKKIKSEAVFRVLWTGWINNPPLSAALVHCSAAYLQEK